MVKHRGPIMPYERKLLQQVRGGGGFEMPTVHEKRIDGVGIAYRASGFDALLVTSRVLLSQGNCQVNSKGILVSIDQTKLEKLFAAINERGLDIRYPSSEEHAKILTGEGGGNRFLAQNGVSTFLTLEKYSRTGGGVLKPGVRLPDAINRFYYFNVKDRRLMCDARGQYDDINYRPDRHAALFILSIV